MPVGSFSPNPWGLYDMVGNVDEWCWDMYKRDIDSFVKSLLQSFKKPAESDRVIRGGSWSCPSEILKSAYRYYVYSKKKSNSYGFRVARSCL
jgi:formylglycine-generating enzyme required for sulfatase activity